MLRSNLLFIHVISAMGFFFALGIEGVVLSQLRRATDGRTVRAATDSYGAVQRAIAPIIILLLLSGFYLGWAYWRGKGAWIGLSLITLVVLGAVGGVMTGRNMRRLRKKLDAAGEIGPIEKAYSTFRTSYAVRLALAAVIVYLMTVKPA